jgi:hypothetical protein
LGSATTQLKLTAADGKKYNSEMYNSLGVIELAKHFPTTKGAFVSEDAIVKQIYLATINAQTRWNGTMFGWSIVRRDLEDYFGTRINNPDTLN